MIKWLELNYGEFTEQVMDAAAQNGHLDILYHLRQHRDEGCSMRAIVLAATNGHLSTVQWIVASYPDKVSPDALRAAISNGCTKVAQWLHSEVNIAWECNLVECAARHGSRELVAWTLVVFPRQCTPAAMDNAALAGNAELFFTFHNTRKTCTSDVVDHFAARGDLVMVRWALENRPEGCSSDAMDDAATNWHLDVVKHLHGLGALCTFRAMDGAAANDHVAVLDWFHLNRPEGCSFNAMDNAAKRGNLKRVKWLHEHGADCTERAMDAAAGQGHLEIVVYLHRERDEGCSRRASVWAAECGMRPLGDTPMAPPPLPKQVRRQCHHLSCPYSRLGL